MNQYDFDPVALGQPDLTQEDLEVGNNGCPLEIADDEPNLEELLAYNPVPPRRTVAFMVRCRRGGRMSPLPYPLDNEEDGE